ncbi:DUF1289 domain-containing protein [Burkholderia thailandensis]|uniref:DUF1289 domain-containing protein n=1 Tax=Burkholderia thailandensis TaxID=57975 RepID=A0AAW9D4E0_BURTH|nr:DUF1289 domain-containing protein [Burkholderia thailandensis]MCS3395038.1 DUF1289 domain-containing protein [Burkholderia thailandensis]MCS6428517.1 DUF1289 domain-containing protein [Burkholderia thailandensis]MCS6456409.1 DUF1289 domain-containing protein [Burkholderia thailandensis]MCS6467636.1 DUF1289 domain-containing protein [Burkholderia thailandensis]MCS6486032.1 DUF1289 domain-containing protein [Burkholderia thailandensis]
MSAVTPTRRATPAECAAGTAGAIDATAHAPAAARPDTSANSRAAAAPPAAQDATPTTGVPSPCTNVCRIDAKTGWCEGCRRTRDEIAGWRKLDDDAKRAVLARIAARQAA